MSDTQNELDLTIENEQSSSESEQFQMKSKKVSKEKQKSKSKSKNKNIKTQSKQKPKKKAGKKKEQKPSKQIKQQKPKKQNKQAKQIKQGKKKPKSKKGGNQSYQDNKIKVLQYMHKQNRPYNLLNVFDNLHGKIKKPQLQNILNELAQQGQFSCKQFGKNKVYFINQDKFDLNMAEVNQLNSKYTTLRQQYKQLKDQNKILTDQYRKLMSKKTFQELELQQMTLANDIQKLIKKRDYLISGDTMKVDEQEVINIQKLSNNLDKILKKRKRLTKDCLDSWAQILEKKVPEVAQIIGIQLI